MIRSAGCVVVRREADHWKFLFLRAYKNWDFPKGLVEKGEDPLETAKREVTEETGITDLHLPWGEIFMETKPYYSGGKKIARYYLAETTQASVALPINPELGRPEHHEYQWLDPDEIKGLAPPRLSVIVEWALGILARS
jgi:8-oxo-dGTP pyrophosphatase MutT (NUDIX family)